MIKELSPCLEEIKALSDCTGRLLRVVLIDNESEEVIQTFSGVLTSRLILLQTHSVKQNHQTRNSTTKQTKKLAQDLESKKDY